MELEGLGNATYALYISVLSSVTFSLLSSRVFVLFFIAVFPLSFEDACVCTMIKIIHQHVYIPSWGEQRNVLFLISTIRLKQDFYLCHLFCIFVLLCVYDFAVYNGPECCPVFLNARNCKVYLWKRFTC